MKKNIQKKRAEIKKALKKGEMTKQDLDISCNRIAQRILKGLEVRENSVEKLFARLQEIRNNVTEKVVEKKHSSKEDLKESTKSTKGKATKKTITKTKKSITGTEKKMEKSIACTEKAIEGSVTDIEKQLADLKEENKHLKKENQSLKGEIERKKQEIENIKSKLQTGTVIEKSIAVKETKAADNVKEVIEKHETLLKEVFNRVAYLEKQIEIEKSATGTEKNSAYHGFSISKLSSGYWQAVRRIKGRPCCIYIGKDISLAQEKIEKWLAKNYPDMLTSEKE